jgi:membrane protein YqaA with SNARE-associated domain
VTTVLALVLAISTGVASALLPIVNGEAALTAAALAHPAALTLAVACALALGQTAGKLVLFESAGRAARRRQRPAPAAARHTGSRARRWQQRSVRLLQDRWSGNGLVLLSASVGVPPLAVVSLAAGGAGARRTDFALCCLSGRTVRFLALAGTLIWLR